MKACAAECPSQLMGQQWGHWAHSQQSNSPKYLQQPVWNVLLNPLERHFGFVFFFSPCISRTDCSHLVNPAVKWSSMIKVSKCSTNFLRPVRGCDHHVLLSDVFIYIPNNLRQACALTALFWNQSNLFDRNCSGTVAAASSTTSPTMDSSLMLWLNKQEWTDLIKITRHPISWKRKYSIYDEGRERQESNGCGG